MRAIIQDTCKGCSYLGYRYLSPDSFDDDCEFLCKRMNYKSICYSEYGDQSDCKIPDWCPREDVVEINLK